MIRRLKQWWFKLTEPKVKRVGINVGPLQVWPAQIPNGRPFYYPCTNGRPTMHSFVIYTPDLPKGRLLTLLPYDREAQRFMSKEMKRYEL